MLKKLFGKPTITGAGHAHAGAVSISGSGHVTASGEAHLTVTLQDRVSRLEKIVADQETRLSSQQEELRKEEAARIAADEALQISLADSERRLKGRIRAAAAGGLRLETIGVTLFLLGVGLATWGGLIS